MNIITWNDVHGFTHVMRCPDGDECVQAHINALKEAGIEYWWVESCD